MAGFIRTLFGDDDTHPKDVARAYYELNQQLSMDEGTMEEQQWRKLFDQAGKAGISPAGLYDPEQGQMRYEPEPVSELDRWKNQIDGLIQSGNPILQQEGLSMLAQYRAHASSPLSDSRTATQKDYAYARSQGYEGSLIDYKREFGNKGTTITNVMGGNNLEGTRMGPEDVAAYGLDPSQTWVFTKQGPKAIQSSGFTDAQSRASSYAGTMDQSEQLFQSMEKVGFDPTTLSQKMGTYAEGFSGMVLNPSQQVHKQAVDAWIRAKLRKESGATISPEEYRDEYMTFFPQPGESKSVIYAKSLARRRAMQGVIEESGGRYKPQAFREAEEIVRRAQEEDKGYVTPVDKALGTVKDTVPRRNTPPSTVRFD